MRLSTLALVAVLVGCAPQSYRDGDVEIEAVAIDIDRYMGRWYEIARFPNRFEEGCAGVTATYERLSRQRIAVVNICREGELDAEPQQVKGRARVIDPGKLSVSFLSERMSMFDGLAAGDYWVLWVDEDYTTAVVGEPSGRTGWILARTPRIDDETKAEALGALTDAGYTTDALHWTEQPQETE